jgi:hypothetical protein
MEKKINPKQFTFVDLMDTRDEEKLKHYTILNYILNKNSHRMSDGGINHIKLLEDLQDYENYLAQSL